MFKMWEFFFLFVITSDVTGVDFSIETIDVETDCHLAVSDIDRSSGINDCGEEWNTMSGHSLIDEQKIGVVSWPRSTRHAIAGEAFVTNAGVMLISGLYACCVFRANVRILQARDVGDAIEAITVEALKNDLYQCLDHSIKFGRSDDVTNVI